MLSSFPYSKREGGGQKCCEKGGGRGKESKMQFG